jgi:hypothetical protein
MEKSSMPFTRDKLSPGSANPGNRTSKAFSLVKTVATAVFLFSLGTALQAQFTYRVLFLGNSYTGVNNLPQLTASAALSAGDTLLFDSNTPGGYQLVDHAADITSQNKIMAGGWHYVVIQGQSQEPVTLSGQFFNGGVSLYNLIRQYNPCAVTMPYMTWGRKNGDATNCSTYPEMCTYQGMDSALRARYISLATLVNGELSPVSAVWRYLRQNNPAIELYQPDESHPSLAGSYAAACCFYTMIFKKDPSLITYDPGIGASDAAAIRYAAKTQVFDSLQAWDFKKLPVSAFAYQAGPGVNEVLMNPNSQGVQQSYFWDFGDGSTSIVENASHSYAADGTYTITLTTTNCDLQGTHTSVSDTVIQFCSHTPVIYTSQPWLCRYDTLWTQPANSYQWFANGAALPETKQYLANYSQYAITGFSVLSGISGCAELSQTFTSTPQWSGYYFDAMGDPCMGDTVAFAVLHTSGSLPGAENILWYKNDTLLSSLTNSDTLLISAAGKYECKVVNPTSACPMDTTGYSIQYTCGSVGIAEGDLALSCRVYPNPASEMITLKLSGYTVGETVQIYEVHGGLVRTYAAPSTKTEIIISDLPAGIYFVVLKNKQARPLRFIKQ